jgi:hypothetical protein
MLSRENEMRKEEERASERKKLQYLTSRKINPFKIKNDITIIHFLLLSHFSYRKVAEKLMCV